MSEVKRYLAQTLRTEDMGFIPGHPTRPYGAYDVVLAADHDRIVAEKDVMIAERDAENRRLRVALAEAMLRIDKAGGEQLTAVGATLDEALNTGDGVYRP